MTKNITPTPVYLDPGMHPGLEVKGLMFKFLVVLILELDSPALQIFGLKIANFHPFEVVCRGSETQLQVGENHFFNVSL